MTNTVPHRGSISGDYVGEQGASSHESKDDVVNEDPERLNFLGHIRLSNPFTQSQF